MFTLEGITGGKDADAFERMSKTQEEILALQIGTMSGKSEQMGD